MYCCGICILKLKTKSSYWFIHWFLPHHSARHWHFWVSLDFSGRLKFCPIAAKLNTHWLNAGLSPTHPTLRVSRELWRSLREDLIIFLRLNPSLIDSKMKESVISQQILSHEVVSSLYRQFINHLRATLSLLKLLVSNPNTDLCHCWVSLHCQ